MTVREMYNSRLEEFVKEIHQYASDEKLTGQAKINMLNDLHNMAIGLKKDAICTLLLSLYCFDIRELKADIAKCITLNGIHQPEQMERIAILMCLLGDIQWYIGGDYTDVIAWCERVQQLYLDDTQCLANEMPFD